MRRFTATTFLMLGLFSINPCNAATTWIVRVDTDKGAVTGKLMHWDTKQFILLGRDGQLLDFDIALAEKSPRFDKPFEPYSHVEFKSQLEKEFGGRYEVTGTGHYMVVHPKGQRKLWSDRFENLYRELTHYFSTRRIPVNRPEYPLVAIVFESRGEFEDYMSNTGVNMGFSLAGFYAFKSNRIALFDSTGGDDSIDWRYNAETIVHEAAHQTAYNIGVHNRFTPPPQWLSEGIGTLFEAKGIYAASEFRELEDRINREQVENFRQEFPDGISAESLAGIVSDDSVFRANTKAAYAFSWAFTFMVAEKQPRLLSEYLQVTANKKPFTNVGPDERVNDFQSVFGDDMRMVATRLNRFVKDLP